MKQTIRPIIINGVEYYTKAQICQLTGYSVQRINQKIKNGLDLHTLKLDNGRCLCRKYDVDQAISSGILVKGFVGTIK